LTVETYYGFKDFELLQGDICEQPADLLVVSSHAGKGAPSGTVIQALNTRYGKIDMENYSIVLPLTQGTYFALDASYPKEEDYEVPANIYLTSASENMPFKDILVIRIPGPRYFPQGMSLLYYQKAVKSIFSALAALEFAGRYYETIALPLLGGERSFPKIGIMSTLLETIIKWLNYSKYTNRISLTIYKDHEINSWNKAMNETIGRSFIDDENDKTIRELRIRLKRQTTKLVGIVKNDDLKEILISISNSLSSKGDISVQQFGMYGRKIVECMAHLICLDLNLNTNKTVFANIKKLEESNSLSQWITYYSSPTEVVNKYERAISFSID